MKNLANCTPTEFLVQTNRIRKSAEKWMKATDILGIRKNVPKLDAITADMDDKERARVASKNRKKTEAQMQKNFSAILDAVLDEHPAETLEILALVCFVEPKDIDKHPMSEYIDSIADLISNKAVLNFFTSLVQLEQMNISGA